MEEWVLCFVGVSPLKRTGSLVNVNSIVEQKKERRELSWNVGCQWMYLLEIRKQNLVGCYPRQWSKTYFQISPII